jgi:adenine-specific DNA methylase
LENNRRRFVTIDGEIDQGKQVHDPAELESGRGQYFVRQASATNIPLADSSVDYIVTDPPYYDSVHYADLSAFFRVWLRQMLDGGDSADIRWEYDQSTNAVPIKRSSGLVDEDYTDIMSQIFKECRRVLRSPHGKLAFTFHHWAPRAWSTLTLALKRAGFELLEIQVVHSENPISVHIANMRALTDDAILILSPVVTERQVKWQRPDEIGQEDSAQFSRDCARLLGWMLTTDLADDELSKIWERKLGRR